MKDRRYGIMGTVLVHMLLLVFILIFKVNAVSKQKEESVMIDLTTFEEIQKIALLPSARSIQAPSPTRQARNIAVSEVEDRVEKYDDYKEYRVSNRAAEREAQNRVDKAVKDIIKENDLNPSDKEVPTIESKPTGFYQARKIEEEQVYKGPTNIYYKLDDRKVSYLPIPVYKCKGGGTVQVDIRVGQRGKVELTTINGAGSDTNDPCFLKAAKDAASQTRFNFSTSAPRLQEGYIIYHFVAQ